MNISIFAVFCTIFFCSNKISVTVICTYVFTCPLFLLLVNHVVLMHKYMCTFCKDVIAHSSSPSLQFLYLHSILKWQFCSYCLRIILNSAYIHFSCLNLNISVSHHFTVVTASSSLLCKVMVKHISFTSSDEIMCLSACAAC